jgi:cytochrome d ubiquinol oxidase subunit I
MPTDADGLLLSRIQFAFTIGFHIIYPTLTLGLAGFLLLLEVQWLRTGDPLWRNLYRFWIKLFALAFGMGVVSGIVLSYEIGTNWSRFSQATANVIGPLLGYEVLTAFFLEAGFLGIMLFGWNRVGPRVHLLATAMVAVGTVISAFWILSANSWMQTPRGFTLIDRRFYVEDVWAVIFNPSFPYRFAHMVMAAYVTSAFVVAAVSAWYVLRGVHGAMARRGLAYGIGLAAILAPLQLVIGDLHGLNTRDHQPMKVAAMEGLWETTAGAPLLLFALPDQAAARNHLEVAIPHGASLILTHSLDGEVKGLNEVPPDDRPNVPVVFFAFRIMVGIGFSMIGMALLGAWLLWRDRLYESRWYLRLLLLFGPSGFVAVIAGWIVAEVGRQPWIVQGVLRTAEGVSPVPAAAVASSLTLFLLLYVLLFAAHLVYSAKVVARGPEGVEPSPEEPVLVLAGRSPS